MAMEDKLLCFDAPGAFTRNGSLFHRAGRLLADSARAVQCSRMRPAFQEKRKLTGTLASLALAEFRPRLVPD
jgi:hypothetical protein